MSVSQKAVLTPRPLHFRAQEFSGRLHKRRPDLCPTVTSPLGLSAPTFTSRLRRCNTADVNQKSTNTALISLKGVRWQERGYKG